MKTKMKSFLKDILVRPSSHRIKTEIFMVSMLPVWITMFLLKGLEGMQDADSFVNKVMLITSLVLLVSAVVSIYLIRSYFYQFEKAINDDEGSEIASIEDLNQDYLSQLTRYLLPILSLLVAGWTGFVIFTIFIGLLYILNTGTRDDDEIKSLGLFLSGFVVWKITLVGQSNEILLVMPKRYVGKTGVGSILYDDTYKNKNIVIYQKVI